MQVQIKQIKETLGKLEKLHEAHLYDFDKEVIPNLEAQMEDREKEFVKLKQHMNELLPEIQAMDTIGQTPAIDDIIDQLRTIIHQNKTLRLRVQHHKDGLENSMIKNTRGRHAINAYGSPSSQRNQPKVLNFRK